jgi:hypothetical protein
MSIDFIYIKRKQFNKLNNFKLNRITKAISLIDMILF